MKQQFLNLYPEGGAQEFDLTPLRQECFHDIYVDVDYIRLGYAGVMFEAPRFIPIPMADLNMIAVWVGSADMVTLITSAFEYFEPKRRRMVTTNTVTEKCANIRIPDWMGHMSRLWLDRHYSTSLDIIMKRGIRVPSDEVLRAMRMRNGV